MDLTQEIKKYYKEFKGLPSNNPIVRENQENDAFEIFVYQLLFKNSKLNKNDIEEISSKIVSPPDEGIDIFNEELSLLEGVDYKYSVIQVKNSKLDESSIKDCINKMKRTIKDCLENKAKINDNLKEIISKSNFSKENENLIEYIIVHIGDLNSIKNQKEDEIIINIEELRTLYFGLKSKSVPNFEFELTRHPNVIQYNDDSINKKSIICSLTASQILPLLEQYGNTDRGKNILFGENLREPLIKGSRTYEGIKQTIEKDSAKFWYYNNGITIVTEELKNENNKISLKNFSIINGAQTTSSFLRYFKEMKKDFDGKELENRLKNLENVSIITRIVETKDDKEFKENITIFNNTQNPISDRDLVSKNAEQRELQKRLNNTDKPIYLDIRRGALRDIKISYQKHRIITNTELAQFIFASDLQSPFFAKDKKTTIFNKDSKDNLVNEYYEKIFDRLKGTAFSLTIDEIDEILFIKEIHKKAKQVKNSDYNQELEELFKRQKSETEPDEIKKINEEIALFSKLKTINNVNTFYNITLYYYFKKTFDKRFKFENKRYNFELFYSKAEKYQNNLISNFAKLFNSLTTIIIRELAYDNPSAFVRSKSSEASFKSKLVLKLADDSSWKEKYEEFMKSFKV